MQKATMATRMTELSFLLLLSVAWWSRVEADRTVTINSFQSEVEDGNSVADSMSGDVGDNLVNFLMNIKKSCPGAAQLEIEVYKDGVVVYTNGQTLKQPMKEFQQMNICGSIDAPEPDDESCSIQEGEQTASQCDVSAWFESFDEGDYKAVAAVTVNNEKLGALFLDVTISA
nr:uncharacterized protein LOC117222718 [Megalopta genalis]